MVPPTLSTASRSAAFPLASSIKSESSWVLYTIRSWSTWCATLLYPSAHSNSLQYTAIEGQGSYLTRGSGQPMKLPLGAPKPLPSLSKALIGGFITYHLSQRLS